MSRIAGIDYSTRAVDVVLVDEDTDHADWHRFPLEATGNAFDRARVVRGSMPSRTWWVDRRVLAVGIEDPRGYGAGHLYRVQGAILQCLPAGLLVQPWIPSAWRKAVGLPGNASKDMVRNHYEGLAWPEQDAYDALSVAIATRDALERIAA